MTRQSKIRKLEDSFQFLIGDSADVYILFADLCGSTAYKEKCVEQKQPEIYWIIRQIFFLSRVADGVKRNGGTVVKTVGDGLIATFPSTILPEDILRCGIDVLQSFGNLDAFHGDAKIEGRVSVDIGHTYNGSLTDTGPFDPVGTAVDRCARLNSIAKKNEIVFSQNFLAVLVTHSSKRKLRARYGYITREEELKGLKRTVVHCIDTSIGKLK